MHTLEARVALLERSLRRSRLVTTTLVVGALTVVLMAQAKSDPAPPTELVFGEPGYQTVISRDGVRVEHGAQRLALDSRELRVALDADTAIIGALGLAVWNNGKHGKVFAGGLSAYDWEPAPSGSGKKGWQFRVDDGAARFEVLGRPVWIVNEDGQWVTRPK